MATRKTNGNAAVLENPNNDGADFIDLEVPYVANVSLEGSCPILFHRWSNEAVAEKAAAKKGSEAKKTDNVESYVYRMSEGNIGIPGQYLVGTLIDPRNGAAKYRQDPRSPRKSALDLYRAGVLSLTDLAPIYSVANPNEAAKVWDYIDMRRVTVQRAGITRHRPAFLAGWRASFQLLVNTPEYIKPADLHDILTQAGRLVGLADFRPTYGRFQVTSFSIGLED